VAGCYSCTVVAAIHAQLWLIKAWGGGYSKARRDLDSASAMESSSFY